MIEIKNGRVVAVGGEKDVLKDFEALRGAMEENPVFKKLWKKSKKTFVVEKCDCPICQSKRKELKNKNKEGK